jgi:phosphatidylglycerophosphate synthase
VLAVLAAPGALGVAAVAAAVAYGAACDLLVLRGLRRAGATSVGPANAVTWVRCALVGGAVGLVAEEYAGGRMGMALVGCAALALVLDAVDGRVARRTGTVSSLGGRFDLEVDASLTLVLSIAAASVVGAWILLVGAARYLLLAAEFALPWLRRQIPPTRWRKVVGAVQGAVLVVVCARVVPTGGAEALAVAAAVALAYSFGTQVWWVTRAARPTVIVTPVSEVSGVPTT